MEASWPDGSGVDYLRRLFARLPEARVIMFTSCTDDDSIVESLMAGALGYLTKPLAPGCLVCGIGQAAQGRATLCGPAQAALLDFARRAGAARGPTALTWSQREIMLLLLEGAKPKEVAQKLRIHVGTVNRHLHDIYHKYHVHRKEDALRRFAGGGGVNSYVPGGF
jgi:DNA-binding NarL/FixJ family response regulator